MDKLVATACTYSKDTVRGLPTWARNCFKACADIIETQAAELRTLRAERDVEVVEIVAWLRGQCKDPMLPNFAEFLSEFAAAIERREHKEPMA